jgi:hypothetical protein
MRLRRGEPPVHAVRDSGRKAESQQKFLHLSLPVVSEGLA